jgi:hypothetical protein
MAVGTAVAAGAVLGVRHALEADHLAAVVTLVDGDGRAGYVGAWWGIGHSIPIAAVGLLFLAFGVRLPAAVTKFFEVVVGVILLALGARMLLSAVRDVEVESHDHGGGLHTHLRLDSVSLGLTHSHQEGESFLVGVVHGLAGSGALVIALVSTAPTMATALWFLAGFSLLSIATMATVSFLWGQTVGTRFTAYLKGLAGVVGIGVGLVLLAGQVGLGPV